MPPLYRLLHLTIPLQMALSMALWWPGADRTFPLLPVFDFLGGVPGWISGVLSAALVLTLLVYVFGKLPVAKFVPIALVWLLLLVALDLNRLQVWVWLWILLWLADIVELRKPGNAGRLSLHTWILAGLYAWSGLHKMTPWFSTNFDWFCEAFQATAPFSGKLWMSLCGCRF